MSRGRMRKSGCVVFGGVAIAATGCRSLPEPCDVNVVPLVYTDLAAIAWRTPENGEYGGVAVPAMVMEERGRGQRVGYLAMDTGSALTFLYLGRNGERYVPRAGQVMIGCERFELPGRNFEEDDDRGIGIVGVLGADYLLGAPSVFDAREGLITRYPGDRERPVGEWSIDAIETVAEVPFEDVEGHIIVSLQVDGRMLRLMWDTGCPHLLWLGEPGRPGDEEITGEDVQGDRFPMYIGTAMVEIEGEEAFQTPTLRVPRFPYYEGTVRALGGNIHGLAGQSVFGRRVMVFDTARSVIRLGERERSTDE